MEIYLIRHTTPNIEKGICYGQSDIDLANTFSNEFKIITSKFSTKEDFKVYSSPLKRCSLLAKQFSNTPVYDKRLMELDFGDWELVPWNNISENEMMPWMKDFVNTAVPNGESYTELASRVNSFFQELVSLNTNKTIIITSHAGPIKAFLASLLNIPLKDSFKIKIDYGDIFELKMLDGKIKLITNISI